MPRFCLICDKPLSEYNRRPVCFCHEVEGQLSKKEIEELQAKKGIQPEKEVKEEMANSRKVGTCANCKREGMAVQKRGEHGELCASCGAAITGVIPANVPTVLEACREKFSGKGKQHSGPKKKGADTNPAPPPPAQSGAVATAAEGKSGPGLRPADQEGQTRTYSVKDQSPLVTGQEHFDILAQERIQVTRSVKPFTVPCTIRVVLADGKVFMSVPGFIEIDGVEAA